MLKVIVALLLTVALQAGTLDKDKQQHMIAGVMAYGACLFTGAILTKNDIHWLNTETCVIPVVILGIDKEIYDAQGHGTPEVLDAVSTFVVPLAFSYTWNFKGL